MGRPRQFDLDHALDAAAELFWRKGYEGTSLSDLTTAMGITPPSFYCAFSSKEELFRRTVDRYENMHMRFTREALEEPTARAVVERLLYGLADAQTAPSKPAGCLEMNCALPCSEGADPIRQDLAARRIAKHEDLRARFEQAKASGDLPEGANADALARYVTTVSSGMAVEASSGASREDLYRVVEMALRCWPEGQR